MHSKCRPKVGHCKETSSYINQVGQIFYIFADQNLVSAIFSQRKGYFHYLMKQVDFLTPLAFMHSKCGPKEGHCKETYKYSIKRVKYARYMRTNFRSLQFFTMKRLFSHIERRKQSFRHPWQFQMEILEKEAPSITCTGYLSTVSHKI